MTHKKRGKNWNHAMGGTFTQKKKNLCRGRGNRLWLSRVGKWFLEGSVTER